MDEPGPYYPKVIRIVRELVHACIDRLDSVNIKSAIVQPVSYSGVSAATHDVLNDGATEVPPPAYVH